MNWYSIFYWITVADGVKQFFDVSSNIFTVLSVISIFAFAISIGGVSSSQVHKEASYVDPDLPKWQTFKRMVSRAAIVFTILALVTWAGYVFTPSKKDALIIVAGGAVGSFITQDSSAKQIPSEVMLLLRSKIKSEINEINNPFNIDTLKDKSKEELIELLKNK